MTYSVRWVHVHNRWATRWDHILAMDSYEHETNWSSLINTILLLLLLGFLVAVILLRAVKNDFATLRELDGDDLDLDDNSNVAWKKLARDVFRQPRRLFVLSVLYGNGCQLLSMITIQMLFALLGFYSPSNRGSFLTYSVVGYAFMAVVGGRSSSKLVSEPRMRRPSFFRKEPNLTLPSAKRRFFHSSSSPSPHGSLALSLTSWRGGSWFWPLLW